MINLFKLPILQRRAISRFITLTSRTYSDAKEMAEKSMPGGRANDSELVNIGKHGAGDIIGEINNSANPEEIKKFSQISESWWDPFGPFMPLHKMNAVRLQYIRRTLQARRVITDSLSSEGGPSVSSEASPGGACPGGACLKGLDILDVGCGGGILSESLARMGANVTGIDASIENIQTAQEHYEQTFKETKQGRVRYRHAYAEQLAKETKQYDVVCAVEIIEHVNFPAEFVETCSSLVKPGGHLFISTMNRTALAYLVTIIGAEYIMNIVPRGTHDYTKYLKPSELTHMATRNDTMALVGKSGMFYNPLASKWSLVPDCSVNYIICFTRI